MKVDNKVYVGIAVLQLRFHLPRPVYLCYKKKRNISTNPVVTFHKLTYTSIGINVMKYFFICVGGVVTRNQSFAVCHPGRSELVKCCDSRVAWAACSRDGAGSVAGAVCLIGGGNVVCFRLLELL